MVEKLTKEQMESLTKFLIYYIRKERMKMPKCKKKKK